MSVFWIGRENYGKPDRWNYCHYHDRLSLYGSAASRKVLRQGVFYMNASGWIQLAFFSIVLLALTKPMGLYLVQVLDTKGQTLLDPALKPVERLIYRLAGIDPG